jgi:CRP/FNR family transcriptional regulator, cyclic AMP receptor protein
MGDETTYYPSGSGESQTAPRLTTLKKAEFVRGVDVFSQATVEDLYRLARLAQPLEFGPRAVVFGENDIGDAFYVLVEGKVELVSEAGKAREIAGPGEAIGLYSVLTGEPRCVTATALEPTLVLSITAEDLYSVLSNNMEIVVSVFKHFVKKLGMGARG